MCFWLTYVFYSHFDCCILFAFKEILCFLHWSLHSFLFLKPLALFCRYYSLELEIYISFSWVGFGLFWTWNAWVIRVVLSLSLLGVILVSFFMLIFSVLGRKDWFFVSLSVSKRSFSFLSLLLYSQVCWTIFFLFCTLFEILDLTFIKKKYLFSALHVLELVLFGNVSEIIIPLSFYASFSIMKR